MTANDTRSRFSATVQQLAKPEGDAVCALVVLPREASDKLPRRGRTSVVGTLNGHAFQATLEPDGQLSHWLPISKALLAASGAQVGELAALDIIALVQEPEPVVPDDLQAALAAAPAALAVWSDTTTIARVDWIHWITSAKQAKTRAQRVHNACDMLAAGKRRVCCFDPSGYYSKALCAPKAADEVQ